MRVAVIGAGPAGMTAGLALSRGGAQVTVFEAADRVGGLARSLELWGQRVDLGPHRFYSTDARVNRLWLDVVGQRYSMVERTTRIYYRGRFFAYPLEPWDTLAQLGPGEAARCLASYLATRVAGAGSGAPADSFEAWVVKRFGRRLFELFFKTYSEKLWGIPCDQLDAEFAAQRIKKFSLAEAVSGAFSPGRRRRHHTLVGRFAYPWDGTGSVYETMGQRIQQTGGQVQLGAPVRRVVCSGQQVTGVELVDGRIEPADHVISTMPLTLLLSGLPDVPADVRAAAASLTFRNTILVYLHVDAEHLFEDQWLYLHAPELRLGRVTNFRNWVPQLHGNAQTTVLAGELWCDADDPLWRTADATLVEQAASELRGTGLLGDAAVLDGRVVRVPRCYPVYRRGYRQSLAQVVDHVRQMRGLSAIGRYGAFKYNNQDHSILMGILAAENLLADARHDLWSVNADYDQYQEATLITETGLVQQAAD